MFGSVGFAGDNSIPPLPNPSMSNLPAPAPASQAASQAAEPESPLISPAAKIAAAAAAVGQAQAGGAVQSVPPAPTAPTSQYTGAQNTPAPSLPLAENNNATTGPAVAIAAQQAQEAALMSSPDAFGNTQPSRAAFTQVLRNLMPLTPSQILTLRGLFDKTQQAVATYPGTPPKPTSSSILVNMSPGATPPIIRLRDGYVTSMVFLDSTGQPWPVVGYDLGNPKAFNIQPSAPDGKSNTLLIQAMDRYQEGNLAVMLKDENTPVMLTLMPGQRAVDYRVDLRIPGMGPNAMVLSSGLPSAENPVLLSFLDGTPPPDAQLLTVEGAPSQAWSYQGFLYLRSRLTILSPGWIATMSSPDGTHVYQLAKTPVILASHRGQMVRLFIKGTPSHE